MTDVGHSVLDKNILPRVFAALDVVFPEFGWRRTRGGWVASNNRFTKERLGARAERVVSKLHAGFLVHGDRSYHWLEYLYGGAFPRGAEWWAVVEALGSRVGVSVPRHEAQCSRERALEILAGALELTGRVQTYLEGRGCKVTPGFIVGELTVEPTALLLRSGFSREGLRAAGISRDSRWEGRVCCLWRDELSRAASLWGRGLDDADPKYLVLSGDTPAFFGADVGLAAARRSGDAAGVVIVEGMFDVLALRARGVEGVVGVGRAGLTDVALRLLERVGTATLLLDADSAGAAGTRRAIETWARAHSPVKLFVAVVEGAKDPDELVRLRGIEALREVLEKRRPAASAYVAEFVAGAAGEAELMQSAARAVPFLSAVGVCHALEAAAATTVLSERGLNGAMLRLLTKRLDVDELKLLRGSLAKRLEEVDDLLAKA